MDNSTKTEVALAVNEMAANMAVSWDGQLNWAITADALIGLIADVQQLVSPDQFAVLMSAAAMAQGQVFKAPNYTIVISSEEYDGVYVDVEPAGTVTGRTFGRHRDAYRHAEDLKKATGWTIRDANNRGYVS